MVGHSPMFSHRPCGLEGKRNGGTCAWPYKFPSSHDWGAAPHPASEAHHSIRKNEGNRLLVSEYSSNHGGYHLAPVKNAYIVTWPLFRTWQPTNAGKRWGVLLPSCRRTQENLYPDVKDFVFDRSSH